MQANAGGADQDAGGDAEDEKQAFAVTRLCQDEGPPEADAVWRGYARGGELVP